MRAFLLVAGAALTLSACGGGGESETNLAVENLAVENLVVNDPAMDANMAANMATNMSDDPATQNAIANDLTTNTPDANLANGM